MQAPLFKILAGLARVAVFQGSDSANRRVALEVINLIVHDPSLLPSGGRLEIAPAVRFLKERLDHMLRGSPERGPPELSVGRDARLADGPPIGDSETLPVGGEGAILLVDDDEDVLFLTEAVLLLSGFIVYTAQDSTVALRLFRLHRGEIRIVLTDKDMDRKDEGVGLALELRGNNPGLSIYLASGRAGEISKATRDDLVGKHRVEILGKPFEIGHIVEEFQEILARPAQTELPDKTS